LFESSVHAERVGSTAQLRQHSSRFCLWQAVVDETATRGALLLELHCRQESDGACFARGAAPVPAMATTKATKSIQVALYSQKWPKSGSKESKHVTPKHTDASFFAVLHYYHFRVRLQPLLQRCASFNRSSRAVI
jgi:hypothetical protein